MSPASDEIQRQWARGRPAREVGEFGLIAHLRAQLASAERCGAAPPAAGLLLGIGDDTAILRPPPGWDLLLTCDILIEGRHFRRDWLTPEQLGARAAAVNLSDIAAMGGLPVAALVSLGVPGEMSLDALAALYGGLTDALAAAGASIAGGNVSGHEQLMLDLTLIGRVEQDVALRRGGAQEGDYVFVTGFSGRAAAAVALLGDARLPWTQVAAACGTEEEALRAQLRGWLAAPQPRIAVGRFLLENRIASAAIDQSDGLAGDLHHICEESGVGIEIDAAHLPIDPLLERLADAVGAGLFEWVLGPSDDYELLFTAPREKADLALAAAGRLGVPIAPIGRVTGGGEVVLRGPGDERVTLRGGWDHLRAQGHGSGGNRGE